MKISRLFSLLILITGLITLLACVKPGEMKEMSALIPLENAETGDIQLKMSAGEINIRGGNIDALLTGFFKFNRKRWEPVIDHHNFGNEKRVTIAQRRSTGLTFGRSRNTWDLQITNRVPLDLELHFGAGKADIDLKGLQVKHLEMHMGVGEVELDLTGDRNVNLEGSIKGGVGHATIDLPSRVGVRLLVDGGIGTIKAHGFTKNGHVYTNDAYGKTLVTIDLTVKAGIGAIDLELR